MTQHVAPSSRVTAASSQLPAVLREYPALARQAANEGWIHEEFLHQLLETEVLARQASVAQRRVREAHFPDLKSLDQIDWDALRGISRPKVAELATCGFIEGAGDVLIAGPIGTGKTHLAIALGLEAARRRYRVAFVRAADLVRSLLEVWPESHWPGFALRQVDGLQSYMA